MKALIFGITGQDGHYLKNLLHENSVEVFGVSRTVEGKNIFCGNVANYLFVSSLIKQLQPDYIFHFSAISSTHHSYTIENQEIIVSGSLNILESVFKYCKKAKVFLAGSALQFQNNGLPINENTPFSASSGYATSRINAVYLGRYYRTLGVQAYVGYFFNHDSPMRNERHINQKIISFVKQLKKGSKEFFTIGDPSVKKEFNFAGDVMQAIWLLINQEDIYEAVIGSGKGHSIEEWIDLCFAEVGLSPAGFIEIDNTFTADYNCLISDPSLIFKLGYEPLVTIGGLAKLMMNKN